MGNYSDAGTLKLPVGRIIHILTWTKLFYSKKSTNLKDFLTLAIAYTPNIVKKLSHLLNLIIVSN
jgi:hypothetical protein